MKVVISAGGTGGHIYPALAIISKIKELEPSSTFLYIGTTNRMEHEIIPKMGIPYVGIEMQGFNRRNPFKNIKTIKCFLKAIRICKKEISSFDPDIVLGIGGYITVPVIYAASKLGYKTFIHEQNSIPGMSNKILMKYATIIGVSIASSIKYFPEEKTVLTGNPRSEEVYNAKSASPIDYGVLPGKKIVLIVMGSLGSKTMTEKMINLIKYFDKKTYDVILVTGKNYYEDYNKVKCPENVHLQEYISDMGGLLHITDLIVSRAGASTLAEITSLGIPSILVPSPYVTNNHQYKNAMALVDAGASKILEEKDFSEERLVKMIDELLDNKLEYKKMHDASYKLGVRDSATKIYELIKKAVE